MDAYRIAPSNIEAKKLEQRLRDLTSNRSVQQTQAILPVVEREEQAHADFSEPVMLSFTRQVQPILINRCGRCHDSTRQREFKLIRVGTSGRVSSKITERNLRHLIQWIDIENPLDSPIYSFAVKSHGGSQAAPLDKTHGKAKETLRQWLELFAQTPRSQPVRPVSTRNPFARGLPEETKATNSPIDDIETADSDMMENRLPMRLPAVDDPFDPNIFNRMHRRASGED